MAGYLYDYLRLPVAVVAYIEVAAVQAGVEIVVRIAVALVGLAEAEQYSVGCLQAAVLQVLGSLERLCNRTWYRISLRLSFDRHSFHRTYITPLFELDL